MKIALIILGLVVVIVAALFIYYGGLRRVDFTLAKQGGETLVYAGQENRLQERYSKQVAGNLLDTAHQTA